MYVIGGYKVVEKAKKKGGATGSNWINTIETCKVKVDRSVFEVMNVYQNNVNLYILN